MRKNREYDFWQRVDIGGIDECWPWTGARFTNGYGAFKYGGKQWRTHRLAYAFCQGDISDNVLHTCDNKPCCNPMHLWDDTTEANVADRVAKGRSATGDRNGTRIYAPKLDAEKVRLIKEMAGRFPNVQVAHHFGVSETMIARIRRGERWA